MNLASCIHDTEGKMTEQTERVIGQVCKLFSSVSIAVTENTNIKLVEQLKFAGVTILPGGLWAEARKSAIAAIIETNDSEILVADFDKVLHMAEYHMSGLKDLTELKTDGAILVGRTDLAWKTYPASWKTTEDIASLLANKYFGTDNWDYLVGMWVLSKNAAKLIVGNSVLKHFDSEFEWVKILNEHKVNIGYQKSDALTWEDPDRNQDEINKLGREVWEKTNFDGIKEWRKRIDALNTITKFLENYKEHE